MAPSRPDPNALDRALAEVLRPGQHVVIGQASGSPALLVGALGRHRARLEGSRVLVGMLSCELPDLPGAEVRTFFPAGSLGRREDLERRGIAYDRQTLYELAAGFAEGRTPVDVVLAQGTEARAGWHSLGASVDYMAAAASRADAVVLETGPAVPWTGSRSTVDAARVIAVGGSPGPLASDRPPSARDVAMADAAAGLIPDGATVQLGMGPWISAMADRLAERRDLRVHSGLVSDWAMRLDAAGALRDDVPIVGTGAGGTSALYRWIGRGDRVQLAGAHETHDPAVLARLPRLHAVNSVLEVDLLGRGNAEIGRGGRQGGIGGLPDFAGAAARALDGCSIIVMGAAARGYSRIVPRLPDDAVSLPAGAIDVVVTEHGVADLRGASTAARAALLVSVAAPEHRAGLRAASVGLALD